MTITVQDALIQERESIIIDAAGNVTSGDVFENQSWGDPFLQLPAAWDGDTLKLLDEKGYYDQSDQMVFRVATDEEVAAINAIYERGGDVHCLGQIQAELG